MMTAEEQVVMAVYMMRDKGPEIPENKMVRGI
ncbi:hypothetical protein HmCmsJML079_03737 [Escherichia coli]|jgi:hypothetical protein|nr:hypothetical protein RX35_01899 [Escherichia coli]VEE94442.1 Uncharacterised protein [Escherichia coli]GCP87110.1 hypothetical protein BvCmsHHP033_03248 [Escherichia coli]GCY60765.1 hypothetical protein HmCmsJML079_03737 [Escherichia coli]GDH03697.1 hypothetical protein BvCmsKKP036_03555 [Escherichia coli]